MNLTQKLLSTALILAITASLPAQAQLLTYTFPGTGTNTPQVPTITADPAVSGQDGIGSGFSLDSSIYVTGYQVNAAGTGYNFPASLAASVTANSYFTFTITPQTGSILDLTSFDLSSSTFFYQSSSATSSYAVEVSSDGFATAGTLLDTYSPATDKNNSVQGTNLTLTGLTAVVAPVEFRIYLYGQPGAYNIASIQNSLSIDGTVTPAVPEPSTAALLVAGMLGALALGRRFAHRA